MNVRRLLSLAIVAVSLPSCASVFQRSVAYDQYPNIPDRPVSGLIRNLVKDNPWLDKHIFYGRYGGFGDSGGLPVDDLDEVFRRHDIVYNEVRSFRALCWSDDAAAVAIARVNPQRLSPAGQDFQRRSHEFFVTPCWRWVGKPLGSWFYPGEVDDSPFRTAEQIHGFFAIPDPVQASRYAMQKLTPPAVANSAPHHAARLRPPGKR